MKIKKKHLQSEEKKQVVMSPDQYKKIGKDLDDDTIVKIVDEDSLVNNPDLYGASKYFAEKILQYYSSYWFKLSISLKSVFLMI